MNLLKMIRRNPLASLLAIALVAAMGLNLWQWIKSDTVVISDDEIREELVPVAKLTTYEFNFTELMFLDEANNPFGITNPITSKRYVATIDGSVDIGTDVSAMKIETKRSAGNQIHEVTVTLPHAQAENPNLDPNTLRRYVEDKGIFDLFRPTTDDLNKMEKQAEASQLKKIEESDILKQADERIEIIIKEFLHELCGEEVEVKVRFAEVR